MLAGRNFWWTVYARSDPKRVMFVPYSRATSLPTKKKLTRSTQASFKLGTDFRLLNIGLATLGPLESFRHLARRTHVPTSIGI
ncbi:MAG: hypothetical protein CMQ29_00220 [Gammaproteobacteria bacterium]|nr:hypothetical protein [Gammaproteobacteria bacterium]